MALNEKKVRRLIGLMNDNSGFGIPAFPPVIRCFNEAMDADTLEYLLRVGSAPHTKETLEELFHTMRATGELSDKYNWESMWQEVTSMCFLFPTADRTAYELAPIFPGWLETSTAGENTEKNVRIINAFMDFWEILQLVNMAPIRAYYNAKGLEDRENGKSRMTTLTSVTPAGKAKAKSEAKKSRTISVNEPLESQQEILSLGNVFEVMERNRGHLATMNCVCRNHKEMETGTTCQHDFPLQTCMPVGAIADQLVECGIAHPIEFDDAVELMKDLERKGCIHTTFHYRNDAQRDEMAICNCCTDCCLLYGGFRTGHLSQVHTKALNKPVVVDENACTGCNLCGKACPTFAINYDKAAKKLVFDYESCIGCGQCVTQCRFGVQKMVPDERSVFVKTIKKSEARAHC